VKSNFAALLTFAFFFSAYSFSQPSTPQRTGHSDPSFSQPSIAPGVNYTVPTEAEIRADLDRVLAYYVRSTSYEIVDTTTGRPITDFTQPTKSAGIKPQAGEFGDWTYSNGVALAGMIQVTEATGDKRFENYTLKTFDFIFDHEPYFRAQAKQFGPQRTGFGRLMDMHDLDDCGAIGAALIKAYEDKQDPRYRAAIDQVATFITQKMSRMPDGTLARTRPQTPYSIWLDDAYMSIPFLAQMGKLTGERKYYDDAAKQVIQMSARLFNPANELYAHAWFANTKYPQRFYWGRSAGWGVMAIVELLSVLPEDHPDRPQILDLYQRAVQGLSAVQSGSGMWHQLLDKTDSYLESSSTAMFTFAVARGVNRGWLTPAYAPIAQTGWQALRERIGENGQIDDICVGTTAAYDAVYYYNRPTSLEAPQGYGPTLMAGAEMITLLKTFDVERKLNTFHYKRKH
jgi:unsaturated rhamnogalacturonyl hydrolase